MVIKGGSRGGAGELAGHLLRADTNERVEVTELTGVAADTLRGALSDMAAIACPTRCSKPLYHASINTGPGEILTRQQKAHAIATLEKRLGLTGHPRAVVEHCKAGREHIHVVWSRIDAATMRAVSDSWNYRAHEEVARQLEREFGHHRVQGAHVERHGQPRPARTPPTADIQQAARTGRPVDAITAEITRLWQAADSGKAFGTALHEAGYVLAQGDRRGFCLVDSTGGVHSLSRRIEGVRTKEVNARLGDIDLASLPTVAQARHQVRRRQSIVNRSLALQTSHEQTVTNAHSALPGALAPPGKGGDVGISARQTPAPCPVNRPTAAKTPPAAAEGSARHSPPLHAPKNRPTGAAPDRPSMPKPGPPQAAHDRPTFSLRLTHDRPTTDPQKGAKSRDTPLHQWCGATASRIACSIPPAGSGRTRAAGGRLLGRPPSPVLRLLTLFLEPRPLFIPGGSGAAHRVTPVKSTPPERLNMRRPDGPSTESIAQLQAAIDKLTAYGLSTGEAVAEQVQELKNILAGMLEQAGTRAILGPYYRPEHRKLEPGR